MVDEQSSAYGSFVRAIRDTVAAYKAGEAPPALEPAFRDGGRRPGAGVLDEVHGALDALLTQVRSLGERLDVIEFAATQGTGSPADRTNKVEDLIQSTVGLASRVGELPAELEASLGRTTERLIQQLSERLGALDEGLRRDAEYREVLTSRLDTFAGVQNELNTRLADQFDSLAGDARSSTEQLREEIRGQLESALEQAVARLETSGDAADARFSATEARLTEVVSRVDETAAAIPAALSQRVEESLSGVVERLAESVQVAESRLTAISQSVDTRLGAATEAIDAIPAAVTPQFAQIATALDGRLGTALNQLEAVTTSLPEQISRLTVGSIDESLRRFTAAIGAAEAAVAETSSMVESRFDALSRASEARTAEAVRAGLTLVETTVERVVTAAEDATREATERIEALSAAIQADALTLGSSLQAAAEQLPDRLDSSLAAVLPRFDELTHELPQRVDDAIALVRQEFEAAQRVMDDRLEAMATGIDQLGRDLPGALDGRFETLGNRFETLGSWVEAVGGQLEAVDAQLQELGERFAATDERVEATARAAVSAVQNGQKQILGAVTQLEGVVQETTAAVEESSSRDNEILARVDRVSEEAELLPQRVSDTVQAHVVGQLREYNESVGFQLGRLRSETRLALDGMRNAVDSTVSSVATIGASFKERLAARDGRVARALEANTAELMALHAAQAHRDANDRTGVELQRLNEALARTASDLRAALDATVSGLHERAGTEERMMEVTTSLDQRLSMFEAMLDGLARRLAVAQADDLRGRTDS